MLLDIKTRCCTNGFTTTSFKEQSDRMEDKLLFELSSVLSSVWQMQMKINVTCSSGSCKILYVIKADSPPAVSNYLILPTPLKIMVQPSS